MSNVVDRREGNDEPPEPQAGGCGHNGYAGHDHHDGDDGHDPRNGYDGMRERFRMRLPSTLPDDTERVMTRVIDCAMAVHKALGPGFLESIYKKAMSIELEKARLPFEREKPIDVWYDGVALKGQRVEIGRASCRERV